MATNEWKLQKIKNVLIVIALVAFIFFGCEKAKPDQPLPEANPQTTEVPELAELETSEVPPDAVQEITEANEAPVAEAPADKPVSVYEAAKFVQPIKEIEMVLVEGGTMMMQGQEISLDSFYISRYVLNEWLWYELHNWAYDNGHLDSFSRRWNTFNANGVVNAMIRWTEAILVCNWLSIMEGLTPVYWKEDRTEPLMRDEDILSNIGREDIPSFQWHPFYVDWEADGYRLPTEAEWEFAARGGNKSMGYIYAGSNVLSEVKTDYHELEMRYIPGQRKPNELGIHDMSGEASQWVLGPWTEAGELEPAHNPGRVSLFEFPEPFYALQKGGNDYAEAEYANSVEGFIEDSTFRPEARIKSNPLADYGTLDYYLTNASVRLVRGAGLQ